MPIVRPAGILEQNGQTFFMAYCYGDRWVYTLPGGKPELGESLEACLRREFWEELNLAITIGPLQWIVETYAAQRHVVHVLFQVQGIGMPTLNPQHTTARDGVWLSREAQLQHTLYPHVAELLMSGPGLGKSCYQGMISQPWFVDS